MSSEDPKVQIYPGVDTFTEFRRGCLYFRSAAGVEHHLPVACGMTPVESGLSFDPEGFSFTKFGVTVRVAYLDPERG